MSDLHLLLEEQIPGLMRYATALTRDADAATDLIEDTVTEALAQQRRCPDGADIRLWLLTTLHDLRDNPFRQANFAPAAQIPAPAAALTLSDLDRALGQLPERRRAVILLIGLEGMTYAETASILRISVGTMRSRLSQGRAGLRRALGLADAPRLTDAA